MKLSVVSSLYLSEPYIAEFCRRTGDAARRLAGEDYEIILVNDGSPDQSLEVAVATAERDPHLVVVDVSRNFGHHKALKAGLAESQGDLVYLIDSDLEEEPEWLARFAAQISEQECDVVYGVQARRKGGLFERWTGFWFYRLFNLLTGVQLPENMVTARLMKRRYVEGLLLFEEREVFHAGIYHITGFDQRPCHVQKHSSSPSTYTLRRKMAEMVNSVTSFSNAPLIAIFYCGAAISAAAGTYGAYIVFFWMFWAKPPSGWTSVIASIWLLGGLTISFIGIIGIYLAKIFSETKRRPYSIVRQVYGRRQR